MSSIRLENLGKSYAGVQAVRGVDLTVADGEFFTILGPSGSGKTTLLTLIAGLAMPTEGRILFGDRDVTHVPTVGRGIGLVFQNYALFPHMTVFDNVAFPLSVRKKKRAEIEDRVQEALSLVRLTGFEKRKPSQMSGGQQQRVALARAIVFRPTILLLDEPLGALDRKLREELQVELKELQRSLRVTTLLVTHDQEEALSLSDRLLVIGHGAADRAAARGLPAAGQFIRRRFPRHFEFCPAGWRQGSRSPRTAAGRADRRAREQGAECYGAECDGASARGRLSRPGRAPPCDVGRRRRGDRGRIARRACRAGSTRRCRRRVLAARACLAVGSDSIRRRGGPPGRFPQIAMNSRSNRGKP